MCASYHNSLDASLPDACQLHHLETLSAVRTQDLAIVNSRRDISPVLINDQACLLDIQRVYQNTTTQQRPLMETCHYPRSLVSIIPLKPARHYPPCNGDSRLSCTAMLGSASARDTGQLEGREDLLHSQVGQRERGNRFAHPPPKNSRTRRTQDTRA